MTGSRQRLESLDVKFSEMTGLVNNNNDSNLVDKSNNCLHSSKKERNNSGAEEEDEEEVKEEQHTIRIPFFTVEKYMKGLARNFDEIIG